MMNIFKKFRLLIHLDINWRQIVMNYHVRPVVIILVDDDAGGMKMLISKRATLQWMNSS